MSHEICVGVHVTDPETYARYRAAIVPFLEKQGGKFVYDFEVARVLKKPGAAPINRVFTLRFRDKAARNAFFSDPGYQAVKKELFAPSVSASTYIAEYDREA